jgi:hypothetical protein
VKVDVPAGQLDPRQVVPCGYSWQAPLPSHLPFVLQEAASLSTHCAVGSTWLAGTLVHVPSAFGSAQDWQAPPQGELQQYPWAQESPVWHSAVLAQTAP